MKLWIVTATIMCPDLFDFENGINNATEVAGIYESETEAKHIQKKLLNSCKGLINGVEYPIDVIVDEFESTDDFKVAKGATS